MSDFFYWPLFDALIHTPEAEGAAIALVWVGIPVALCFIGLKVFLIGVRR